MEKQELKNHIQQYLESIPWQYERFQQTQKYHHIVAQRQDSLLLAHSLEQLALVSTIIKDTFHYRMEGQKIWSSNSIETFELQENQNHLYYFADDVDNIYFKEQRSLNYQKGIYLQTIPKHSQIDLYTALGVYKDETGSHTFEVIRTKAEDFELNNSMEDFDAEAVYWVKLNIFWAWSVN